MILEVFGGILLHYCAVTNTSAVGVFERCIRSFAACRKRS
jgi:hypothetical protein